MHIVHLEDESPLREILRVALTAAAPDINLQQFVDSDKAMEYAKTNINEIDLYILDIRVPGSMTGLELAKELRKQGSKSIIAMASAYRAPQRTELNEFNLEWFAKPWHIMEVLDKLIPMIREKQKNPK